MLTKTHATTWIRCGMCDTAATVEHAVATGWVPYCYADRVEIRKPTCPTCAANHLVMGADGQMELRTHSFGA
jgi:hypothetical protein